MLAGREGQNSGVQGLRSELGIRPALLLSAFLHLLIIRLWLPSPVHPKLSLPAAPLVVQLHPPTRENAPSVVKAPSSQQHSLPKAIPTTKPKAESPRGAIDTSENNRAEQTTANISLETSPSGTRTDTGDLISKAKRDAIMIDREMRRSQPQWMESPSGPKSLQSQLEQGIRQAAKPDTQAIEQRTFSNGQRITKVSGPSGTYCIAHDASGASDRVINCGHLFD